MGSILFEMKISLLIEQAKKQDSSQCGRYAEKKENLPENSAPHLDEQLNHTILISYFRQVLVDVLFPPFNHLMSIGRRHGVLFLVHMDLQPQAFSGCVDLLVERHVITYNEVKQCRPNFNELLFYTCCLLYTFP